MRQHRGGAIATLGESPGSVRPLRQSGTACQEQERKHLQDSEGDFLALRGSWGGSRRRSAAAKSAAATVLAREVMHERARRDGHGSASQTGSKHNASKFTGN